MGRNQTQAPLVTHEEDKCSKQEYHQNGVHS